MATTRLFSVVSVSSCASCETALCRGRRRTPTLVANWNPNCSRNVLLECASGLLFSGESVGLLKSSACRILHVVQGVKRRLTVRSTREDKEDPIFSIERMAKPVSDVPMPDIRGGIVALGKFDALHAGHRALAEQAARMGPPVLMSFSGMGPVLGWAPRLPVAALCDRKRIMSIWAKKCGGVVPQEYSLEFVKVRSLSPREFVQKLSKELQVKGVVAGTNYRFGYKAAGDVSDLVHLCNEYGLQSFIVDPVMDQEEECVSMNGELSGSRSRENGQISSTRVRKALAMGNMERVSQLLGRDHRLVLKLDDCTKENDRLVAIPVRSALNQYPGEGTYKCNLVGTGEHHNVPNGQDGSVNFSDDLLGTAQVTIGPATIEVSLADGDIAVILKRTLLGIEFSNR